MFCLILLLKMDVCDSGDITLVTAFFKTSLKIHNYLSRLFEEYVSWFGRWARIENDLIVFCQSEDMSKIIMNVRREFKLENKTKVVVKDIYSIDKNMYERMLNISRNVYYLDFLVRKNHRVSRADYDFVVNMKTYFLHQASLEFDINTDLVAWIDFGFDHRGELYCDEKDFSFMLSCDQPLDKIGLFHLTSKVDNRPFFDIVRTHHPVCVMGGFILCPKSLTNFFWKIVNESIYSLLDVGVMTDDQPVLLLASRIYPQMFHLKPSAWYFPIYQHCNGSHMKINKKNLKVWLQTETIPKKKNFKKKKKI